MSLVERVKAILQKPKETWPIIEAEKDTTATLYLDYAVMLAAIPPVATFVGVSMTGYVGYRVPIVTGAIWAVVGYVLSLASIYLSAFIIDALAGVFGGTAQFQQGHESGGLCADRVLVGQPCSTCSRRWPFCR